MFPRLYAILDGTILGPATQATAQALLAAGVKLFQYRHKNAASHAMGATSRQLFEICQELSRIAKAGGARFIVNDRCDIARLTASDGVHLGQEDLGAEEARAIVGEGAWIGISTHTLEEVRAAAATSADYIAVGPIFATTSKDDARPVVGLEFIAKARKVTKKPLVAIGGITLETAPQVFSASADSVAVIRDLLSASDVAARARQYLDVLGAL
jgi:thiamine-phosphate pyrophosphorylase